MAAAAVCLALWVLCMMSGCATARQEMTPEQKEASLRVAVEQYWNARIEGKYDITYGLEDKEGLPADFTEYKLWASVIMKVNPLDFSVQKIVIEGEQGTATLKLSLRMPNVSKPIPKVMRDAWVFRSGKWLHRFDERKQLSFSPYITGLTCLSLIPV
jgi:hypothetical protein